MKQGALQVVTAFGYFAGQLKLVTRVAFGICAVFFLTGNAMFEIAGTVVLATLLAVIFAGRNAFPSLIWISAKPRSRANA